MTDYSHVFPFSAIKSFVGFFFLPFQRQKSEQYYKYHILCLLLMLLPSTSME